MPGTVPSPVRSAVENVVVAGALPVLDTLGLLHLHREAAFFSQLGAFRALRSVNGGAAGKRVLFMCLKGSWKPTVAWEFSVATALRLRGAECTFLLCDEVFPKCDVKVHYNATFTRCWSCHTQSRLFARHAGLPTLWLSRFIAAEERDQLARVAFETPYEQLDTLSVNGIAIDYTVKPSLVRFFRRGTIDGSEHSQRVHREFVHAAMLAATALPRVLDQVQPEVVVTVNGKFFAENILFQLCCARQIDVYTYEWGKVRNTVTVAHNRVSVDWENPGAWQAVRDRDLLPHQRDEIEAYVRDRRAGRRVALQYHPNPVEDDAAVAAAVGLQTGKRLFVLFANIVWDSAVQYKDAGFKNMFDWLRLTIDFFARHPEANLVVRLHPAETKIAADVTQEKSMDYLRTVFPTLPDNVRLIPPESDVSSYKLIDLADAVLVYTSTIGLESALERKPTVVCGITHYWQKGFTVDVTSERDYYAALEGLIAAGEPPDLDWAAAWKYAYVFFFKSMVPDVFLTPGADGLPDDFSLRDPAALAPGADGAVDRICDALLHSGDVLSEPGAEG